MCSDLTSFNDCVFVFMLDNFTSSYDVLEHARDLWLHITSILFICEVYLLFMLSISLSASGVNR